MTQPIPYMVSLQNEIASRDICLSLFLELLGDVNARMFFRTAYNRRVARFKAIYRRIVLMDNGRRQIAGIFDALSHHGGEGFDEKVLLVDKPVVHGPPIGDFVFFYPFIQGDEVVTLHALLYNFRPGATRLSGLRMGLCHRMR